MEIVLDGHENIIPKQREYDQQKAYIEFLENVLDSIKFYANGVRVIFQREEFRKYGE